MGLKRVVAFGLFTMILTGLIIAGIGYAAEQDPPFPSYGSGLVEVRLYTDYFCPPCRAMEPTVEPLLKDLLNATPTCVIIKNGQRKAFVGRPDILSTKRPEVFAMNRHLPGVVPADGKEYL